MFIEPEHLAIVKNILHQHVPEYEVWAFGSRVHGQNLKPFSDLDLIVITDKSLDLQRYSMLKDAFSESDLPFRVDIADWTDTNQSFRGIINEDHEVIQTGKMDV